MLNEGFGVQLPINKSEILIPYINFCSSEILVESVVKAIHELQKLTLDFEKDGIYSGISEEKRSVYYTLKETLGSLNYGLINYTNTLMLSALNEKYEEVVKKEENECCPFCGSIVKE